MNVQALMQDTFQMASVIAIQFNITLAQAIHRRSGAQLFILNYHFIKRANLRVSDPKHTTMWLPDTRRRVAFVQLCPQLAFSARRATLKVVQRAR